MTQTYTLSLIFLTNLGLQKSAVVSPLSNKTRNDSEDSALLKLISWQIHY